MRLIHRPLLTAVLHVVKYPRRVLVVAAVTVLICAGLAAWKLDISSDQNRLFDPNVQFFRNYLSFTQNFPENEATYVLIQPTDPAAKPPVPRWTALADAITRRLSTMPKFVTAVDSRVPLDKLGPQGLLFDDPPRVQKSFQDAKQFIPLVKLWAEKPGLSILLGRTPIERFLAALGTQKPTPATGAFLALLARSWNQTLDEKKVVLPDLAALDATDPSRLGYYYQPDQTDPSRSLMLVRVYERSDYTSLTAVSETIEAIRDAAKDEAKQFPEFTASVTGRPALEADEMRTTDTDSSHAEIIAAIAVLVGLVVMLRSLWLAIAGEIALAVGIGWTFGWATISVGELNLLSIVFLLALIGIGMDYLVQILTRYRREVARRERPETIWISVFWHVSPPINTACLGAAGAFFVSVFTHFRGAGQLGIIAGGGLLLCLLAGYTVLPALLTVFPLQVPRSKDLPNPSRPAYRGRRNLMWPVIWILFLIAGLPLMWRTQFDPGLLTMQAPQLESVRMVNKLQTWSAVVLSKDLETLRRARAAVQDSPTVDHTESVLTAYGNLDWLQTHRKEFPTVAWTEPIAVETRDLHGISNAAQNQAKRFGGDAANELSKFAANVVNASPQLLSAWQTAFVAQLRETLAAFTPVGLNIAALPPEMRGHYVGADGSFALYIYPKADLWQQANLRQFVKDVESRVDAVPGERTVTGIASNIYHSTASIEKSFHRATLYALLLIVVLVFLDLRHLGQTLAAVSVLALGLPMLVAVMGLLHVDWNFANFFGLPILIGAGHEYGVFMVHRYRENLHDPRRIWRRWDASDRALLLCAYVTCSSFGFFWAVAHHEGLRSLGLVMALGTACIYLSAVMVVRPMLLYRLGRNEISRLRHRDSESANPQAPKL